MRCSCIRRSAGHVQGALPTRAAPRNTTIATLLRDHRAHSNKEEASSSSSSSHQEHPSSAARPVQLNGWVKSIRKQKRVSFINLNDGSDHAGIQAVLPASLAGSHALDGLTTGASVTLAGRLVPKQGGKLERISDEYELHVESLELLGQCDGKTYPIQNKEHSMPFLRRNAHLRGRTSTISSMLRLRDAIQQSCYSYFKEEGYHYVTMPLATSSDCEGAGEVFSLTHGSKPFYDRPTYLSVSGQLHLEALTVGGGLGRCWHLAPAFRAERSDTSRHLNEFWMCEAELAFTRDLDDVMEIVEGLVRAIAKDLQRQPERHQEMLDVFPSGADVVQGLNAQEARWTRMSYYEAIEELTEAAKQEPERFTHRPSHASGLKSEHERYIADKHGPTFVTDYPASQKPFYMRTNDDARGTVACFDLLVPRIGELAGGSLREERLDKLEQAMRERAMRLDDYDWYLDLRRYGSVKHGGFGLGWERLISWLLGIENVRETIAFPRGSEGSRF